jgi:hypothetical protein
MYLWPHVLLYEVLFPAQSAICWAPVGHAGNVYTSEHQQGYRSHGERIMPAEIALQSIITFDFNQNPIVSMQRYQAKAAKESASQPCDQGKAARQRWPGIKDGHVDLLVH